MIPLVSSPLYSYPFPHRHRFPMQKFGLLREYLDEQGLINNNLHRPGRARRDLLELAHCSKYLDNFINGELSDKAIRRLGLPWSEGLVTRTLISPNGTFLTAQLALKHGIASHLAGGTHHAHADFGSGYCALNDLAVTALALLAQEKVSRVLIFDCDVHQGDGTASILADEPNAITVSVHCEKNFPARKQYSDLDLALPPGLGDEEYLTAVLDCLNNVLDAFQPDFVLYDAGVDIYEHDPLGLLNVSEEGIRQRDREVIDEILRRNIPLASVIGGGYDRDQKALAKRHAIVVEEAARAAQSL